MINEIFCVKLQAMFPSLVTPPFPGELGDRIYREISAKAWEAWLNHQTILINEYRLNLLETKARSFLKEEMVNFLFGEGSQLPDSYVPPPDKTPQ